MTFVGLDLHKRYITACALSDGGELLNEVRRMSISMNALRDFLGAFTDKISVAMETIDFQRPTEADKWVSVARFARYYKIHLHLSSPAVDSFS